MRRKKKNYSKHQIKDMIYFDLPSPCNKDLTWSYEDLSHSVGLQAFESGDRRRVLSNSLLLFLFVTIFRVVSGHWMANAVAEKAIGAVARSRMFSTSNSNSNLSGTMYN